MGRAGSGRSYASVRRPTGLDCSPGTAAHGGFTRRFTVTTTMSSSDNMCETTSATTTKSFIIYHVQTQIIASPCASPCACACAHCGAHACACRSVAYVCGGVPSGAVACVARHPAARMLLLPALGSSVERFAPILTAGASVGRHHRRLGPSMHMLKPSCTTFNTHAIKKALARSFWSPQPPCPSLWRT